MASPELRLLNNNIRMKVYAASDYFLRKAAPVEISGPLIEKIFLTRFYWLLLIL